MVFGLSKTKSAPIAIDFGGDSIKLLQVSSDNRPKVIASAVYVLPDEARNNPAARLAFFESSIMKAISEQPFEGKRVICSLPAYQTLIQNMELNKSENDKDYLEQIKVELISKFSVDPDRMIVRWYPMTTLVQDGVTKQEILCMAAGEDVVIGLYRNGQTLQA